MQVLIISWLIFISKKIEGRIESKMSEMDSAIKTVTVKVQYIFKTLQQIRLFSEIMCFVGKSLI